MTETIRLLSESAEFWKRRSEEQLAYIAKYKLSVHTRPDHESVVASAYFILDKCALSFASAASKSDDTNFEVI